MQKRKGIIHSIMLAMFALVLIGFVIAFLMRFPFWTTYNEAQAKIIAYSISSSVSVLSVSNGSITEEFERGWDIKINKKKVQVIHGKVKSGEVKMKTEFDISNMNLENVKKLLVKRVKENIMIRKVE